MLCIVITFFPIIKLKETVQIGNNKNYATGYRHGEVIAKILNGHLKEPNLVNGKIGITSLIQKSEYNNAQMPIILVDHDQYPNSEYPIIQSGNAIQTKPWYSNQLFGNQYLLTAIAEDGLWTSNIGGKIAKSGQLLLGSNVENKIEPFIIKHKGTIYINDSDPFVDRLANYQKSAIYEIVYGIRTYRVLNILFLLGCLFKNKIYGLLILFCAFATIMFYINCPINGDVRIVGEIRNPHEPAKISGTLRSMVDAGFPYISGNSNCSVLIVDTKKFAKVKQTEKVIIACEGATIYLEGHTIQIGNLPLGDIDGVVDARTVVVDKSTKSAYTKINDIIIIGTDSPAKQDWNKWLP